MASSRKISFIDSIFMSVLWLFEESKDATLVHAIKLSCGGRISNHFYL